MADIADILDALEALAVAAVYPNGPGTSLTNTVVQIAQGWPPANLVNSAIPAGQSIVSIYAVPSSTSKLPVPLNAGSPNGPIIAPVHGMSVVLTEQGFTLTGQPGIGEYATVIIGAQAFSEAATAQDTAAAVAGRLATDIAAAFPGTSISGSTVNLATGLGYTVRIGASGTLGSVIDRQRQNVMVSVWAPNPSDRTVLGKALDVAIKSNLVITLPDTSQAILLVQTTSLIDKYQDELAFRRDLTVNAQWDTLDATIAYEVTSVGVTMNGLSIAF